MNGSGSREMRIISQNKYSASSFGKGGRESSDDNDGDDDDAEPPFFFDRSRS